jgi:hypothetical protein
MAFTHYKKWQQKQSPQQKQQQQQGKLMPLSLSSFVPIRNENLAECCCIIIPHLSHSALI